MTDALKQGVMAYVQQLGAIAAQGGDVTQLLTEVAAIISKREKGTPLHEAVLEAFTPKTAPEQQGMPQGPPGPGGGAGGPQGPGGIQGLPPGVAAGQQGMAPGGRPGLMELLAGLSGNNARMGATIQRRQPIGG
jgi:hypothetical protein